MAVAREERTMTPRAAGWFPIALRILRAPHLWWTALRQLTRMIPPRWWRRPPFLPLPDRTYMRFRIETAYGATGTTSADDVVRYLEWCRATERAHRGAARTGTEGP
jgi:hypothetical protein